MTDVVTQQTPQESMPPSQVEATRGGGFNSIAARPEFGALIAAIAIFIFFAITADTFFQVDSLITVLTTSAQLGIVAIAVGLLMIGGEFDLSSGVASATAALSCSMLCYNLHLNMITGAVLSLILALAIGFLNGLLVVRTGIPSFLVTLGTFFVLQGANLGVTKLVTGTVATQDASDIQGFGFMRAIFAHQFTFGGGADPTAVPIIVLYWLIVVALATWVMLRTRIGNWILAVGGNQDSARAVGVPVAAVKIGLFMFIGLMAWFYGQYNLFTFNTIQANQGVGNELIYIIAAVVGGILLTGGYGSAVGTLIGSLIFGMTSNGIVYAGWDPNWFKAFLGVMLLLAVAVNLYVRRIITKRR